MCGALRGEAELSTDEGGREVEQLRAQISDLKAQLAQAQERTAHAQAEAEAAGAAAARPTAAEVPGGRTGRRRPGWRGPVATLLIILGCVLAPLSVLAVWTDNQVSNTSRYVRNISPLIGEPAVRAALTEKITTAVTRQLDVQAVANQAAKELSARGLTRLGTLISNFSGSIASGVNGLIHGAVAKIVASPLVTRLWIQGNTVAHAQLVKALSGQNSAITVSNGKVVIGLAPFIDQVKHNLAARGLTLVNKLPQINPTFALFSAKYLVQAQSLYRLLHALRWVLPVLTIVMLAAGIYVARRHRRALTGAGLGLAASMLVLAAAIAVARTIYLNKIPASTLPADAAAVVFDTIVRFIKQGLRVILVIGLIVAIAGFFTGSSVTAVRTRNAFKSGFGAIRGTGERAGVTTGPVGRWVYRYRTALRVTAVAIAALAFVFWTDPTGLVAAMIAVVLLGVLGLIELIGRPPAHDRPARAAQIGKST